jgi:glutamyl-Q tRNA(Asp) synthetase
VAPAPGNVVTRFAPSPTGRLHRGHAFSALTAFRAAQAAGGRFLLRIEDIDKARCRPEFEAAILEDLAWLGVRWEEPVRRQSERMRAYAQALDSLRSRGLLYRCFRTRRETLEAMASAPHGQAAFSDAVLAPDARPADPPPKDTPVNDTPLNDTGAPCPLPPDEEARLIDAGRPFAWRLRLAAARAALGPAPLTFLERGRGPAGEQGLIEACPETAGDVVLARKDLGVSYHLAVVVDDADQGVTDVIRGCDLFAAAHVQRLLQALLDLPTPTYRHHPLLLRPDGKRFAKRDTAETLADLRARGVTPADLKRELGLGP